MEKDAIPHIFGKYRFVSERSRGLTSIVALAMNTETNEMCACKFISFDVYRENKESIDNELMILKIVKHPNIIRYIETIWLENYLVIVTEYLSGESLINYIMKFSKLKADDVIKISAQILSALQYLHSLGICHRDIKPDNIVFDAMMRPKILDFGFAVKLPLNKVKYLNDSCGTLEFVAPEILLRHPYSGFAADMWSFGVTIYTMSVGLFPWPNNTDNNVLAKAIAYGQITIPTDLHDIIKYIISKTLVRDPAGRATAFELLKLPPFQRYLASHVQGNNTHSLSKMPKLIKPNSSAFGKSFVPQLPRHSGQRSSMLNTVKPIHQQNSLRQPWARV